MCVAHTHFGDWMRGIKKIIKRILLKDNPRKNSLCLERNLGRVTLVEHKYRKKQEEKTSINLKSI